MRTLALDISLNTGWAFDDGEYIEGGTAAFQSYGKNYGAQGRVFRKWLTDLMKEKNVSCIVIEQSFFHKFRPGRDFLLNGLAWEAHRAADMADIPIYEYSPLTIKKYICGTARAGKTEVIEAVKALGYNPLTEHEADATALLLLHISKEKS